MTAAPNVAGLSNALPPTAERVVEGETYAVVLDLNPIATALLRDIAVVLHQNKARRRLLALAVLKPGSPEYARQMHIVSDLVTGALRPMLHPSAAEDLSSALWDAKEEPSTCTYQRGECANYAAGDLCVEHQARAEAWSGVRFA